MTTILELTGRNVVEVSGAEVIVTTILEPTGHHAYGMCGTFRFSATAPPFHRPAPTNERDLGPLVSALV
jgi:hypothetical protein